MPGDCNEAITHIRIGHGVRKLHVSGRFLPIFTCSRPTKKHVARFRLLSARPAHRAVLFENQIGSSRPPKPTRSVEITARSGLCSAENRAMKRQECSKEPQTRIRGRRLGLKARVATRTCCPLKGAMCHSPSPLRSGINVTGGVPKRLKVYFLSDSPLPVSRWYASAIAGQRTNCHVGRD
jgi:hypothetical protein